MREEVREFFESGKLEEYLMGLSSPEDSREVEHFINNYPEVKKEYIALQHDIEEYAKSLAIPAPLESKSAILNEINSLKNQEAKPPPPAASSTGSSMGWIAGIAAVLCLAFAGWFWSKHAQAQSDLSALQAKYDKMIADCEEIGQDVAALEAERELLLHSATQTVTLEGDAMGADFYATAFWNKEKSVGHLNASYLPKPPDKHCFQIWADVDGKMVNLGVLPQDKNGLIELPFKVNATSLNVTIEPEGGSDHPTVARLVASVAV